VSVLDETRLSVSQAAARLPGSHGATSSHRATVVRWITRGVKVKGVRYRLEAERVGGVWVTSAEALLRFRSVTTAAANPGAFRTPAQRQRDSERAEKELIAAGW